MSLNEAELGDIPLIEEYEKLPKEWKLQGRRVIKTKKGEEMSILVFERPAEPNLELFAHSCKREGEAWLAKKSHIVTQHKIAVEWSRSH